jgi:hypothetical protein
LVSVGGGGYAAGAMRLALQQDESAARPADVYCAGTSELDYTRRHGRYRVVPRLPRKRGLATLARELAGSFPDDGPLVYVTDGGHYKNLGLIELFRRRPAEVYCVDASGDHGGVPGTLAAAIELTWEESGGRHQVR